MLLSPRKKPSFRDASTGFLRNDVWETSAEIPYRRRLISQNWEVLLIGHAAWEICSNQSEALCRPGQWHVLRCRFAGKPVEASWNVGYFLTGYILLWIWNLGSNLFKVLMFQDAMYCSVVNTDTGSFIHLIMVNRHKWVHVLFKIHCIHWSINKVAFPYVTPGWLW